MSHLNRDGVAIYYNDCGTGPTTVILTHGYSATSSMWQGQIETFSDRYRIIT